FLAHDLRALGGDPSKVKAVPATERLLRLMSEYSQRQPISLLGLHYVLLGSKHGGKYIAHQLQKNYELEAGAGNKYFDPYGAEFMPLWLRFKEAINESQLNEQEGDALIAGARQMYASVKEISDD